MEVSTGKPFLFSHGPKGVILLHSYSSSSADMRMLGRYLERKNYTVYAPVFSGHGKDPLTVLNDGNPDEWWEDTQLAIRQLKDQHISQIAIFGLSLGGLLATKVLENDSSLAGGGVFASPIVTWSESNVPEVFPKLAADFYQRQGLAEKEIINKIEQIKEKLPYQLAAISQMTKEINQQLGQITRPFFVGQGGKDRMINPDSGRLLQEKLKNLGVPVDYHFYPNAGHVLTIDQAHKQLFADVDKFLQKIFEV